MNKIPFTSQNPYAFYAKTIDSYDTENTRKKQINLKRGLLFFPPHLLMEKTCLGPIQY